MIVGVDVYHDASRKGSSFAGIVSSMNDLATRYFSMVKEQKQGQEIMDALRVAFIESLIKYWEINRNWPTDIGKVLFWFKILPLDGNQRIGLKDYAEKIAHKIVKKLRGHLDVT